MTEDDQDDYLFEAFKRDPNEPRPEWAFQDTSKIAEEMEQIPLFMTSNSNIKDNPQLAAFQNLLYDGTPDEIATNFKNRGNESYEEASKQTDIKKKRMLLKEALNFYEQGLQQDVVDSKLKISLFLNKAATNMALENYGFARKECEKVLALDSKNIKANTRLSKILLLLNRPEEALKYATVVNDHQLISLIQQKQKNVLCDPVEQEMMRYNVSKVPDSEKYILSEIPIAVNIPDVCLTKDGLLFSAAILYPPYGLSDFVGCWHQDTSINDQLDTFFESNLDWDTLNLYTNDYRVFMRYESGIVEIPKSESITPLLGSIIKSYDHGWLAFYILPLNESQLSRFLSHFDMCYNYSEIGGKE